MRRLSAAAVIAGLCLPLFILAAPGQDQRTPPPEWENPRVFAVGKEPAHATLVPYPDESAALRADSQSSPFVRSLDGL